MVQVLLLRASAQLVTPVGQISRMLKCNQVLIRVLIMVHLTQDPGRHIQDTLVNQDSIQDKEGDWYCYKQEVTIFQLSYNI